VNAACKNNLLYRQHIKYSENQTSLRQNGVFPSSCNLTYLFRYRNHIFYGWGRQTAATPANVLEQRQHLLLKNLYILSLHIHNTF